MCKPSDTHDDVQANETARRRFLKTGLGGAVTLAAIAATMSYWSRASKSRL